MTLEEQNEKLKFIVSQTLWMARRYADGRSTFAPSDFNECVHILDDLGLGYLIAEDGVTKRRFAKDGTLGEWNPETKMFKLEEGDEPST